VRAVGSVNMQLIRNATTRIAGTARAHCFMDGARDLLRLRGLSGAKDEFLLVAPPKICENWRSSSPFRPRSSPHRAEPTRLH
jgi:hypothetical protein